MLNNVKFALGGLIGGALGSEKLIFEDNFDKLDLDTWKHELTLGGGGNWEFEWYKNNRTNSFTEDGILYLQPTLTSEAIGEEVMKTGDLNIWGGAPADSCTSNAFYGCDRNAASGNYINPISSARLRSVYSFNFQYGRTEIRAQLPKGDWTWPAIWLLPTNENYGTWPASGEIDLMESRGNSNCPGLDNNSFGSTLHWGPNWDQDAWDQTTGSYTSKESLADDFHIYGMYWSEDRLYTYIDTEDNIVLDVDMSDESFFEKGGWTNQDNPWKGQGKNAPFDQKYYFIFNVAVGGTNSYFPDGECDKPWSNTDPSASNTFYDTKSEWYPSWNYPETHQSAMKIDYVKVWSLSTGEEEFMQ